MLTMGCRDVAFDQASPIPLSLPGSVVTKLNDQRAYVRLGISHVCRAISVRLRTLRVRYRAGAVIQRACLRRPRWLSRLRSNTNRRPSSVKCSS
jgi:hypothetical protein